MRFLYFTDTHFSIRPPASRTESYGWDVLNKIEWVGNLAMKKKVDAILFGGDLFHGKDRVTHHETVSMIRCLAAIETPLFAIWGNHDASGVAGLKYRPYGVLEAAGALCDLDIAGLGGKEAVEDWRAIRAANILVTGVGFMGVESPKVYLPDPAEADKAKGLARSIVLLTHGMLFLDDRDAPFEHTNLSEIKGQTARVVCCGHVHDYQGAVEHGGCLYLAPGALTRVSRPESKRQPKVCVFDISGDDVTYEFIDVPTNGDAGFLTAVDAEQFSADNAKSAAAALTLHEDGGDLRSDIDAAIDAAAGQLGEGPEVAAEAKAFVKGACGDA